MNKLFLHGLDSSGSGTKGRFFSEFAPDMLRPDFNGTLDERMEQLRAIVSDMQDLVIVGSSFGGLMGACLAQEQPETFRRLIMLAPALNFIDYRLPEQKIDRETILIIGRNDTVTPPDLVIPAARGTFANPQIQLFDDDHLLHRTFRGLDWTHLLS
jgi:pimeloyl-ACP methyl ester carboxylesterase